ncbi:MAG: hypothetical protein ACTSW1_03230 [Candidatus Hodarchaeales archaeon]
MDIASLLNIYCRKIGIWFLSLVPIFLALSLIQLAVLPILTGTTVPGEENIKLAVVLTYLILIIIAIPFSLNGIFMEKAFNAEIKRITKSGILIQGVEGFDDVHTKIKLLYRSSYSVTITVIISFLVYLSSINLEEITDFARIFIIIASIGLLAISSGASILLRLPDKSALQPGGLMKFYSPSTLPLRLDNILSDSIFNQLDPITRIRIDEWSKSIIDHINPNFQLGLDDKTKLERAREKIFLLVYLKEAVPEILSEEVFFEELREIIAEDYINYFISGKDSGISLKILNTILRDVRKEIPQIFDLIQRLFVLVKDNIQYLYTKNEIVIISHPNSHIGNIDPFRIVTFVLNLKESRKVLIRAQTSMSSLDPDDASQTLLLDVGNLNLPPQGTSLEISSSTEPTDVLRLISEILQVGDALNLQFRANRFGTHVLNISVEDTENGLIYGSSVVLNVYRDPTYYAKTLGAKLLGYAGAALSFIGIGLGSLAGMIQNVP